uniref:Uncharacterized protein n=1 Tax=Anguilla anguilla TaxID=7936 RepID=A0A0E9XJ79_ANGAN
MFSRFLSSGISGRRDKVTQRLSIVGSTFLSVSIVLRDMQ